MHVWFGFIFRCEALQEYWRHPEGLQYFTTFNTSPPSKPQSLWTRFHLRIPTVWSFLLKSLNWKPKPLNDHGSPTSEEITLMYYQPKTALTGPISAPFCDIQKLFGSSGPKLNLKLGSDRGPQYRSELVCYTMLYHYCGWSINTCIVIDMSSLAIVLGSLIFTEIHKHSSTAVHKNPKNNVLSTEKWPNIPPLLRK